MSKAQRVKRLRNVRASASSASSLPGGVDDSHSQENASNSESSASALGSAGSTSSSTSSPTEALTGYDWYGEYVELTQRHAWRVAAYIAWAASPAVGRKPATQLELAQAIGLKTDRTIRQWKEKEPGIEAEIKRVQAGPLLRHRRDLYEALMKSALLEGSGGHADRRLALEMMGDYTPRLKQTLDANVKARAYTADELGSAQQELEAWEKAQESKGVGE